MSNLIELKVSDASFLRKAITAVCNQLPQANLEFKSDGLSICGMDPSHTSYVSYFLSANDCASYTCKENKVIGMTMKFLDQVFRMSHTGEECTLTVQKDSDTIGILLVHTGMMLRRTFDLPTLDLDLEVIDVPHMDLPADITMKTAEFTNVMKQFHGLNADCVVLHVAEEGFTVEAEGDMKGSCLFEAGAEDRDMAMEGDSVRQVYSLKLLHGLLTDAAPLASLIYISFGKEQPIRFTFQIGERSKWMSYTAPKIMDD